MRLKPIDSPELIRLVAEWMSQKENYRWLEFGNGKQILTGEWLKIMTQRETDVLRVFTSSDDTTPIGVVGLSDVERTFKTGRVWVVVGDKSAGSHGYGTLATSKMLTLGFQELGLHAVNTWIVECHALSLRIAERVGFRFIGRQRECHVIDGRAYDRLWFDFLASEHKEL